MTRLPASGSPTFGTLPGWKNNLKFMKDSAARSRYIRVAYFNRKTSDLVRGRVSIPGATYFLTIVEKHRRPGFSHPQVAATILGAMSNLSAPGDLVPIISVVMPDHAHILARLGDRLALSQCIGKLKTSTKPILRLHGLEWQASFHDHQLRPSDDVEAIARYAFLNPYRAGMIGLNEAWPWWRKAPDASFLFEEQVATGGVPSQWLDLEPPVLSKTERSDEPAN